MNLAAARMMARDPRISASGLRFLLLANISAREFRSGFRIRTCGECLALSTISAQRLPVARKSKIHGGRGDFFSTRYGRIMLTYTSGFRHRRAALQLIHRTNRKIWTAKDGYRLY